ncbi:NUDIX domain-containing protein [Aquimarina sp. AD10]|uniref:NUDIX hydrolase n=1 Tax=Aquimarina sp. AD10 TaxID=1714849 RepID=UPI000E4BE74B|nr:NUDIX domain-containing protein [Aquimarina sp. AD10]AXT63151.1 NUDIX domain-containing protein [Aquimarina sp. AD10]RKM98633.1 NUDIX domain-containing protein [Aquimarina sp. AD10]
MYKVFVNNTPIILSTKKVIDGYQTIPIKKVVFPEIIRDVLGKEAANEEAKYHFYHKNENKLIDHLYAKLPVVVAGGGKAYNTKDEILFIYRNGKWDLPKGKIEKNEHIETAAIREVEEETGVTGLEITKFLYKTFHVFKRNGEFRLKVTYWFEMKTEYDGVLLPQKEEGITKVKWKNKKKAKKALTNSYANIKKLFSHDYLS